MPPETYRLNISGAPICAHLDHAEVLALMQKANVVPGAIPLGCDTGFQHLRLATGEHALAICQRGITPLASDNERQINGWSLLVLEDAGWSEDDARAVLESVCKVVIDA